MPNTCDDCGKVIPDGKEYQCRIPRPSDKADMCCIFAVGPCCKDKWPGAKLYEDWVKWIEEGEGHKSGFLFLS